MLLSSVAVFFFFYRCIPRRFSVFIRHFFFFMRHFSPFHAEYVYKTARDLLIGQRYGLGAGDAEFGDEEGTDDEKVKELSTTLADSIARAVLNKMTIQASHDRFNRWVGIVASQLNIGYRDAKMVVGSVRAGEWDFHFFSWLREVGIVKKVLEEEIM